MYTSILVPLDGSRFAERAASYGAALAAARGGTLHLLGVHTVVMWPSAASPERYSVVDAEARSDEMAYLMRVAARLEKEARLPARPRLVEGSPGASILEYAKAHDIDLIVMSSHGRGGVRRVWLGSVTDEVLRHAEVPMLVVRPDPEELDASDAPAVAAPFSRVLVALDGNDLAEAALDAALDLPLAEGASVLAFQAVQPPLTLSPYLPHTVEANQKSMRLAKNEAEDYLLVVQQRRAARAAIRTRSVFAFDPAAAILTTADREGVDLIVMGTHARGGIGRLVLGSVADRVIRGAHVPVFVMPARARMRSRTPRVLGHAAAGYPVPR